MERDGLYYFFEQAETGEKMVVTDTLTAHAPMPQGESFRYSPPSSMQAGHEEEVVTDFILTQRRLPQKVQLRDYNYQTPSQDLSAEAMVSPKGHGVHYLYGLHFLTASQGSNLAGHRIHLQHRQPLPGQLQRQVPDHRLPPRRLPGRVAGVRAGTLLRQGA
jgi:type VI secretion system secreted protein VgrG